MQPDEIITKTALAKQLGVGRSCVAKYLKQGMPVREDGRLDKDAVLAWVAANVQQRISSENKGANRARRLTTSRTRKATSIELAEERARLVKAQADAAEFKLARERGEYVKAADVERQWSEDYRAVQGHLLGLPSKIGAQLGLDRRQISLIDDLVRDALNEAADRVVQDARAQQAVAAGEQ